MAKPVDNIYCPHKTIMLSLNIKRRNLRHSAAGHGRHRAKHAGSSTCLIFSSTAGGGDRRRADLGRRRGLMAKSRMARQCRRANGRLIAHKLSVSSSPTSARKCAILMSIGRQCWMSQQSLPCRRHIALYAPAPLAIGIVVKYLLIRRRALARRASGDVDSGCRNLRRLHQRLHKQSNHANAAKMLLIE